MPQMLRLSALGQSLCGHFKGLKGRGEILLCFDTNLSNMQKNDRRI